MTQLHEVQRSHAAPSNYVAPASLDEAIAILGDHGSTARVIAGGTDLLLELARGSRPGIDLLIDLSVLTEHDGVTERDGLVVLGATTTHSTVVGDPRMREIGLPLAQACLEVGAPALRNRATVVGNLVTASPANDTISALHALGAEVTIRSVRGTRIVPIAGFYTGFRSTVLEPDELVSEVSFPSLGESRRGIFVKLGLRQAQAISVVHAAAVVEFSDGLVTDLKLALGSVGPTIELFEDAATLAFGKPLADVADEIAAAAASSVNPIDDSRATADYRHHGLSVALRRALHSLAAGSEADTWPDDAPRLRKAETSRLEPSSAASQAQRWHSKDDLVACTVNGAAVNAPNATTKTLLDWIRDDLGLTGSKEGCAEGECGACTVHMDGQAVLACLVPAARAEQSTLVTIEGISDGETLHPVQRALEETGGVQCGFCTPGFVMSSVMLNEEIDAPTDAQIEHALAGNLCRCTGYYSIIEAIRRAAR